jgi:hypothetical protein
VAIGHRTFFRREGEIVDALIVREPGTAVELFNLDVFENRDTVLVSSGHGGSLFLRGHGTHLFVHRADADPKRRATLLTRTSGSLSSRTDMLLVADAELFRPAADAAACSRRLQSRQRAFADDIALELGLLQFPAKR